MEKRLKRSLAGVLHARLPELGLDEIEDPRAARGRRWQLQQLLTTIIAGMVAGNRSLAETETFTCRLSRVARRLLGIHRRVPDTTLREMLTRLAPKAVCAAMHRQVRTAHRRKALKPQGLPFGVVAVDGKVTALEAWDVTRASRTQWDSKWNKSFAQVVSGEKHCLVRTVSCSLVSTAARPFIDVVPVPAITNEMGTYPAVLNSLATAYDGLDLFRVVSADSGSCSEANARLTVEQGLDYFFALKDNQPTLMAEARRLLGGPDAKPCLEQREIRGNDEVVRRLYVTEDMTAFLDWSHLRTVIRIEKLVCDRDSGLVIKEENHYRICSLAPTTLTPAQWLLMMRNHWGVENNCHNILDTVWLEDKRPGIVADPKAMVVMAILRRIALNLLTMFRTITQRSDEKRHVPWKTLLGDFAAMLVALVQDDIKNLRRRKGLPLFIA